MSQASTFDTARNGEPLALQQSSKPPLPQPPAPDGKAPMQAAPPAARSKQLSLFGGKPFQAAANKAGPATGLPKPSAANSKAATTPSTSLKQSLKQAAPFDSSPLAQTLTSPPAQNTLTLARTVTPVSKRVAEVPEDSLSSAQPSMSTSLADCEGPGGSGSKKNRPDISSVEDDGHKKRWFKISLSRMMPHFDRGCFGILTAVFFLCSNKKSKSIENDALNKVVESLLQKTRSNRSRFHEVKVLVN